MQRCKKSCCSLLFISSPLALGKKRREHICSNFRLFYSCFFCDFLFPLLHFATAFSSFRVEQWRRSDVDYIAQKNAKVPFLRVSCGWGRRAAVRDGPGRSVQLVVQVSSRRTGHRDPQGRVELQPVRGGRKVKRLKFKLNNQRKKQKDIWLQQLLLKF